MNANELMIDNWIMRDGIAMQVIAISGDEIACGDTVSYYPSDMYEPIPLSPEILEKCGFRASVENAGNLPCFKKVNYTISWWGNKWQMWIKTVDLYKSPQYLHQLQNLLFSLGNPLNVEL